MTDDSTRVIRSWWFRKSGEKTSWGKGSWNPIIYKAVQFLSSHHPLTKFQNVKRHGFQASGCSSAARTFYLPKRRFVVWVARFWHQRRQASRSWNVVSLVSRKKAGKFTFWSQRHGGWMENNDFVDPFQLTIGVIFCRFKDVNFQGCNPWIFNRPLKIYHPKRTGLSSNCHFSGAMLTF